MGATFSLADLIPEPLTFVDLDGQRYDARTAEMFGATDYARYERMQREAKQAFATLQSANGDRETAAAALEQITDDLMTMIVPTLARDRVRAIAFGHKFRFLQWWQEQQPKAEAIPGEVVAGQKSTRARRSPASAAPTRGSGRKAS